MSSYSAPAPDAPDAPPKAVSLLHALRLDPSAEGALDRIGRLTLDLLDAHLALVALAAGEELVLESCVGGGAARWEEARGHLELAREVLRTGETRTIGGGGADASAFLGVPLRHRSGVVAGVLGVVDRAGRSWGADEVRGAAEMAVLLENELQLRLESAARVQAETALRRSGMLYRQLVESASDIIYRADTAGYFTYANPAAERLTGYRAEELVGMHFNALVHPDHRERLAALYAEQMEEARTTTYHEFAVVTRDGRQLWLGQNVQLLREDGVVTGVQAVARDITRQREMEQALRESEQRYRLLVEGGEHVFFYVHDLEHRFEYLSPSVASVLGYTPEELVGRRYDVLLAGDDGDAQVHEQTEARMTEGQGFSSYTAITRHRDGRLVPIELVETPVVRDGTVVGLQGFARDVTERHRVRAALERSEEYFRSLTENALDVIHVINPDRTTRYVSPSVTRLLGYAPEELVGREASEMIDPDDVESVVELLRAIRGTGASQPHEFRVRHKDGSQRIFEGIVRNLRDDPVVAGIVINSRDITERRAAEEALRESEERYRRVLGSIREVVFQTDREGRWSFLNAAWTEITGHPVEQSLGREAVAVVAEEDRESVRADLLVLLEGRAQAERRTLRILTREGERRWVEVQARSLFAGGEVIGVTGTLSDVTERRRAQEESVRLAALSRENPNPVLECSASGCAVHVNPAAEQTWRELGLSSVEALLPPNHAQLVRASLQNGQSFQSVEVSVGARVFTWSYRPQPASGVVYLFAADITGRRHMEEQLRHDALHDALTGLPNRLLFLERLAHAILRAKRVPTYQFAVLFLDLDRFKVVNDSLGHHVGDELLVTIAKRLQSCLRTLDTVARLGGDEFAILLEDIHGVEDATYVAERIREALSAPVNLSGLDVFTSASVGIALSSSAYERPEYLLRNADMAMYQAKAAGQARFEVFDRAMHAQALTRLQMETDLRRALERGEFRLHYQPIVSLRTGRIREVEALVRWEHPQRGWMAPDEFIRVAEETGLILPLGDWVLREACRQVREWQLGFDGRDPIAVAVNLSAKQFTQTDLAERVGAALRDTGLPPGSLLLEITESAIMENAEAATVLLCRLKELGIRISLDDFGTGYSSLSYLHRFPLDVIKIDRSFIGRVGAEERGAQLVQTILALARSLGVTAVAEGIETETQHQALRQMGCDAAQGYLFARPLAPDALRELLEEGRSW